MTNRYKLQEEQYVFPYHHLPSWENTKEMTRFRFLSWGYEYMCYMEHIVQEIDVLQPQSLLDVGCGDGRLFKMLKSPVPRMLGVDLAESAVHFARGFNPGAEFLITDAKDIKEVFDAVVAIEVLEHIPDDDVSGFLKTLAARTKPNGVVIISVPSDVTPVQKKHFRHYTVALLREQLVSSKVDLHIMSATHVYHDSFFMKLFRRLTANAFWKIDLPLLNRYIWRYVWRRLCVVDAQRGKHLVFVLKRRNIT